MSLPRIGTYNILIPRTDKPEKGPAIWENRKADVVDTICEEFDIVGLQECSFGQPSYQGEYVAEQLKDEGWHTYSPLQHGLYSDPFHSRLPIFWRPEVFNAESAGQLLLSSWTEQELKEVPILENRYASFVKGRLNTGQKLLFFTLHLQHSTAGGSQVEQRMASLKRDESARRILGALINVQKHNDLTVIAGDFNTADPMPMFEQSGLQEVSTAASTLERWNHSSFHDWDDQVDGKHIDRIFVSSQLVGGTARVGESLASDHYPVSYRIPKLRPTVNYEGIDSLVSTKSSSGSSYS